MQIENAALRAGKPWKPRAIVKAAQQTNRTAFERLTEQVVGRWIDPVAKMQGMSKWKQSVIDQTMALEGNSPGGKTTRAGILVRTFSPFCLFYIDPKHHSLLILVLSKLSPINSHRCGMRALL
jgi:hypothetical protein